MSRAARDRPRPTYKRDLNRAWEIWEIPGRVYGQIMVIYPLLGTANLESLRACKPRQGICRSATRLESIISCS